MRFDLHMKLRWTIVVALLPMLAFAAATVRGAEALLWLSDGRPNAEARQAVNVLASAGTQGLDPRDYAAAQLERRLELAMQGPAWSEAAQVQLDEDLTS